MRSRIEETEKWSVSDIQSRLSASECSLTTLFQFFPFFMTNTRKMKIMSVHQYFLQRWGNCYRTSNFEQDTFLSAPVHRFLWDNFSFVEYCGFHSLRPISSLRFRSTPIFLQIHGVHYSPSLPWRAMVLPFWSGKKGSPAQSHKVDWNIRKFVAWFQRISFPKAGWQRRNNLYAGWAVQTWLNNHLSSQFDYSNKVNKQVFNKATEKIKMLLHELRC